jgi:lipopolysaccharide export system permease protein
VEGKFVQAGSDYRTDREMNIRMMSDQVKNIKKSMYTGVNNLNKLAEQKISDIFGKKIVSSPGSAPADEKEVLTGIFFKNQNFFYQLQMETQNLFSQEKDKNSYLVEIEKKYSIPFACLVFILIGAPLGIMARRGNMAVGLGLSLVFFVLYWAFLIGGEELADRLYISPFWAMWSANILLALAGTYILVRSTKEMTFISWKWAERFIPVRFRKALFGENP